jgi:hypothetical protein
MVTKNKFSHRQSYNLSLYYLRIGELTATLGITNLVLASYCCQIISSIHESKYI